MEMTVTRLIMNLKKMLKFRIEWIRGTNRVQSKTFEFDPAKNIEGQIMIKEKFEM